MIQWMHQLSKSWVASLLMGGLALSFVVWGIADVFTGQSAGALATVGSTEISADSFQRTYRNFLRNQGQQMGMDLTPELAQKMGFDRAALLAGDEVRDRYQLGASVVGAVACGWLDAWEAALASGDAAGMDVARRAMASSPERSSSSAC